MSEQTKQILTNADMIAISQDPECRSCCQLSACADSDTFILVNQLQKGDLAIGFFNFSGTAADVGLNFWDIGLPASSCRALHFYDCLAHQDTGLQREHFSAAVSSHCCKVYRCAVKAK